MPLPPLALPDIVARLADVAAPWQSLYSDSRLVSTAVNCVHVGALLVAGGLALGADRQTLRAARASAAERARQLTELAGLHRLVLAAFAVVAISGVALFLADVEAFAASPVYWSKMGLVVLLLANGALMTRAERTARTAGADDAGTPPRAWRRLRAHAATSAALWLAVTLAGVVLREG